MVASNSPLRKVKFPIGESPKLRNSTTLLDCHHYIAGYFQIEAKQILLNCIIPQKVLATVLLLSFLNVRRFSFIF